MIWQGNPDLKSWWSGLLGPGQIFDTDRYCVVCANLLGSCYGSTGPQSTNPDTGRAYGYADFPRVNIRDSVAAHYRLVREGLGATSVAAVVGGSLGGMQTLEWGAMYGTFVKSLVVMSCGAAHSSWQIAISEAQRQVIFLFVCFCLF